MEKSWKEAIVKVLRESEVPLHYSDITDQILAREYYRTDGATPAATVNAQLASSIKHEGDRSPFIRVSKGTFALREYTNFKEQTFDPETALIQQIEQPDSIVKALGMYWQRDLIIWKNEPRILGKQQVSSKPVDFSKQKGVYILYDHHTVIYAGRSTDRPLGKRLYEHTLDRLSGRWNRFSWFGLLDVTHEGNLIENTVSPSQSTIISTLESILIETLEPPQNRRRGDDLAAIEYIQHPDPKLKAKEHQALLQKLAQELEKEDL